MGRCHGSHDGAGRLGGRSYATGCREGVTKNSMLSCHRTGWALTTHNHTIQSTML